MQTIKADGKVKQIPKTYKNGENSLTGNVGLPVYTKTNIYDTKKLVF